MGGADSPQSLAGLLSGEQIERPESTREATRNP